MASGAGGGICPRCAAALLQATQTEMPGGPGSGHAFTPPSVAELAPAFPQLEVHELLGCGGMGAVYKARQKELDRLVALKILPPGIGDDPAFAERFTREAKALARLNHPGIVTIHDFGRAGGLYYLLMEFVDGVTLRRLLEDGRVSPREALAIVPQICDALQYAHDQGIVHRDIKPENILLDRRGRVKVADFGLAKLVGTEHEPACGADSAAVAPALTGAREILGTPAYMAPEQAERPAEVDHRADIYALGVVFYQMLTGELPPKPLQPPSRKVRIDVRLDEIVLQALEKEPERRYQQASQVKTAVEAIATPANEPGKLDAQSEKRASANGPRKGGDDGQQGWPRWWQVFLAGILAVLLVEFAVLTFSGPGLGALILGLLASGCALATFLIAGTRWLNVVLVGILIVFLSWLAVAGAMAGALPLAAGAGVSGLVVFAFAARRLRSPRGFLAGFAAVFLLVFGASALITFILPEYYSSTVRLKVERGEPNFQTLPLAYDPYFLQTEFGVIQSELILGRVIDNLNLQEVWGKAHAKDEKLTRPEAIGLLKTKMALHVVRNATLLEIRVFSQKPTEAADTANEIARVYADFRAHLEPAGPGAKTIRVLIVESARPGLRPVRPNKPLNLAIGAWAGLLLGAAGGAGLCAYQSRKKTA